MFIFSIKPLWQPETRPLVGGPTSLGSWLEGSRPPPTTGSGHSPGTNLDRSFASCRIPLGTLPLPGECCRASYSPRGC